MPDLPLAFDRRQRPGRVPVPKNLINGQIRKEGLFRILPPGTQGTIAAAKEPLIGHRRHTEKKRIESLEFINYRILATVSHLPLIDLIKLDALVHFSDFRGKSQGCHCRKI